MNASQHWQDNRIIVCSQFVLTYEHNKHLEISKLTITNIWSGAFWGSQIKATDRLLIISMIMKFYIEYSLSQVRTLMKETKSPPQGLEFQRARRALKF